MSRIRVDDSAEYWRSLPCSLLRDSWLSYEARGVACHLLSLGRNWQLRAVALPRVLHDQSRAKGHLGRDLCRRILRELEDARLPGTEEIPGRGRALAMGVRVDSRFTKSVTDIHGRLGQRRRNRGRHIRRR